MAERRAVPLLRQLAASDSRTVRGFHSVAQEATDAIKATTDENSHTGEGMVACFASTVMDG
jgi:hypothetical protein